jgi:hypothetical protein
MSAGGSLRASCSRLPVYNRRLTLTPRRILGSQVIGAFQEIGKRRPVTNQEHKPRLKNSTMRSRITPMEYCRGYDYVGK